MRDGTIRRSRSRVVACLAVLLTPAAACQSPTPAASPTPSAPAATSTAPTALSVVATTSIVGDVVGAVGGSRVAVAVLIAPDTDPHDYKPTPGDLARVETAAIVFENGLHLEDSLSAVLASAGGHAARVVVSDGVATLRDASAQTANEDADDGHAAAPFDNPHVWWDPVRVQVWTANIARALGAADPAGAAAYAANADAYAAELTALDAWIREQTASVPPDRRVLVTDHELLGYFATAYGFEVIGAVIPSPSADAEPSAKELAALEAAVRARRVPAIFVGTTAPSGLAERVAADTGARLVPLHAEALSGADGPAATYLAFMRHNVATIVDALR